MSQRIALVAIALACALVSGCASTPESRISREPAVFAAFPAPVQAKVRKGEIEIGYTRDMVRLALGLPEHRQTRITELGQTEIWIYTGVRYVSRYAPVDRNYYYHDRYGRVHWAHDAGWVDAGYHQEYPILRLEFSGPVLRAIERAQP